MNNAVLQRCLIYMYTHFLNLKISFPLCSLKFTYLRYTVSGGGINNSVYLLITIFIIFILDYKERTRILSFNNLKHGGLFQCKIKSLC